MGLHHTDLDAWKRGRKGLIITMGDEPLNPYLPAKPLAAAVGDGLQADVETRALYSEAARKFDICHMHVLHGQGNRYFDQVRNSFGKLLPAGRLISVDVEGISDALIRVIEEHAKKPGDVRHDEVTLGDRANKGFWHLFSW